MNRIYRKRRIVLTKDFDYEAYGKHHCPAGTDLCLPVEDNGDAIITVGHGHYVIIPKEFFLLKTELEQNYADTIIEMVMRDATAAGVDISTSGERAIVIDALREAMQFFAHPTRWDKIR